MDEDARTIFCGNLSEKVTEDILYELFLQGGPLQRVSIPRDRNGKQRSFGFITYKHLSSVQYAIQLFDGTALYNRIISLKSRTNSEDQKNDQELDPSTYPLSQLIHWGNQMQLCNPITQFQLPYGQFHDTSQVQSFDNTCGNLPQLMQMYNNSGLSNSQRNNDRRSHRSHPYYREQERDRYNSRHESRHNNYDYDGRRDHSSQREKHSREYSHRTNRHDRRNYR